MLKHTLLFCALVAAHQSTTQAGIMVTQSGAINTVTIDPITFTRTANGDAGFLIIEDYWANVSTASGTAINPHTVTYSINGGPALNPTQYSATGRITFEFEGFDTNDLAFDFNSDDEQIPNGTIGDTIVIGGTFSYEHNGQADIVASSEPWQAHLSGTSGTIASVMLSNAASVPEPSTFASLALGLAVFGAVRQRHRCKSSP